MKTRILPRLLIVLVSFVQSLAGSSVQTNLLSIPSITPWTDSGIDVAAGDIIEITASGTVTFSFGGPPIDADGAACCSPNDPLPQTVHLSLIGKISGDGSATRGVPLVEGIVGKGGGFVGTSYRQTAANSGRLFLGFNDDKYDDISGAFSVTVKMSAAQAFKSHTYQAVSGDFTWLQAKADAEARGGHLATITSQGEFDHVRALGVFPDLGYWLGATDELIEGVWLWVTGEPVEFNRWRGGEPNNSGPENYLIGEGGSYNHNWNDVIGFATPTVPFYLLEIDQCTPHKAKGTAQLVEGFVVRATITDSGCGYTNAPLVLIQGGGGSGATARAEITDGRVTRIIMTDAGFDYETPPRIVIASPPFVPTVSISVSKVKVVQNVVLGRNYVLESSQDAASWSPALPPFTATSESITNEFDTDLTGRYFRVRETR